jgi:hypothetical protein
MQGLLDRALLLNGKKVAAFQLFISEHSYNLFFRKEFEMRSVKQASVSVLELIKQNKSQENAVVFDVRNGSNDVPVIAQQILILV